MSTPMPIVPASVRGALRGSGPGARGFERMARNSTCMRLQAVTVSGVSAAELAQTVYGIDPREGQSPFAIQAGDRFEKALLDNGGAELIRLYREAGRLSVSECRLEDVTRRVPGTNDAARAARRDFTEQLFRQKLASDPAAPNLIVKPRLAIVVVGEAYEIEPDLLVAADAEPFYRVVEMKSYPYRGGKTDPSDIKAARRQAAVGVVALRRLLMAAGRTDVSALLPARADLVLRKPGRAAASLHDESIVAEVAAVESVLNDLPGVWADVASVLAGFGPGATLDAPGVLDAIPNEYRESCREHCSLWQACRRQAAASGDPSVLGSEVREALAGVSLPRAIELRDGIGAPPSGPVELALASRLRAAEAELARVV
ncbi:MAG: hypothetical protein IT305_12500 [Chloroflexi bacterium]|nr:hypothetical protein [Chloroflexota bacterium]